MGTMMVVVVLPSLQFLAGIVQRDEFVDVKEFIAQSAIERLDQPIVRGFAGSCVVELDSTPPGPFELRSCSRLQSRGSARLNFSHSVTRQNA